MDDAEQLQQILQRAQRDPSYAVQCIDEAQMLARRLAIAPYNSSKLYLPGLYLPCTGIVEVSGIPTLAPGVTSQPIPINIKTPGVVVGLMAATGPLADNAERVSMSVQLTLEEQVKFASNGFETEGHFASFSGWGQNSPWFAVMIPARGSGGWSATFRNSSAALTIQPVFNLAFVQGEEALWRCFPRYRDRRLECRTPANRTMSRRGCPRSPTPSPSRWAVGDRAGSSHRRRATR